MTPDVIKLNGVSTPRIDEYFGLWSIEPNKFQLAFNSVSQMDLRAHVATTATPRIQAAPVVVTEAKADNEVPLGSSGKPATKIGIVSLTGPLMKQVGSLSEGTSTVEARLAIRKAVANEDIGAIMFLIDSPGGTVSGTADLAAEIEAACAKKPCAVFIEDLCASAAYWAAAACPRVYANNGTCLIGSIGVYMGLYDLSGWAGQKGIKAKLYGTGDLKGAGFPGTEITAEQDEYFQAMVEETNAHFKGAVSKYRKMSMEKVATLATGAVFHAEKAVKTGLIDGIKSFDEVVGELAMAAEKRTPSNGRARAEAQATADLIRIEDEPSKDKKDAADSTSTGDTQSPNDSTAAGAAVVLEKEVAMSDPGKTAASLKELKAALPKSTAEFREACIEAGLTVEQAKDKYIADQDAALEDARERAKKIGPAAIRTTAKASEKLAQAVENPRKQLADIAAGFTQSHGLKRHEAFARACRENPELRKAMLVEHNLQHGRRKAAKALMEDDEG